MTATPAAIPVPGTGSGQTLKLSALLGRPITARDGESLGRLSDVIVRLRGEDYPLVTGLVATVGGRQVFVPIEQVSSFDSDELKLTSARLDLRRFERRDGEVLLRADVLGHRLIDVESARLVRARTGCSWCLRGRVAACRCPLTGWTRSWTAPGSGPGWPMRPATSCGTPARSAISKRPSPSSLESSAMPPRLMRAVSAAPRCAVRPLRSAQ